VEEVAAVEEVLPEPEQAIPEPAKYPLRLVPIVIYVFF
jgi:hypothetical protein